MYVLCKLFDYKRGVRCLKCGTCTQSVAEHLLLECANTEQCRVRFWQSIYMAFGVTLYMRFIGLTVVDQVQAMFSGHKLYLSEDDLNKWLNNVIYYSTFHVVGRVSY